MWDSKSDTEVVNIHYVQFYDNHSHETHFKACKTDFQTKLLQTFFTSILESYILEVIVKRAFRVEIGLFHSSVMEYSVAYSQQSAGKIFERKIKN